MGGGDNGAGDVRAQQAETEAKKQAARDALNLQFGIAPSAPDQRNFWHESKDSGWTANLANGGILSKESWGLDPLAGNNLLGSDSSLNLFGNDISGSQLTPGLGDQGTSVSLNPGDGWWLDQAGWDAAQKNYAYQQAIAAKNKSARDLLYSTVRDNAFTAGQRKLNDSRDQAQRDLKFELFAKGLNGGSVDVDQNALLGRNYGQGVLDLGAKADSTVADMRGADETTRLGLLQSVDAGMDQGTALSSALGQLKVNNDRAAAEAAGTAVGDVFGGTGALYNESMRRKGVADAQAAFSPYLYGRYNTNPKPVSTKGAGGVITSTGG